MKRKVHGKTERPVKFTSWHKKSAWQQIEHQALALGHFGLYRKVQGKDLHAVEAQCHPYCREKFRREYQSHIRGMEHADNRTLNTEQACQAAAHREAFNAVVEMIKNKSLRKIKSCSSHLFASFILTSLQKTVVQILSIGVSSCCTVCRIMNSVKT